MVHRVAHTSVPYMNLHQARLHLSTLDKASALYQEISRVLLLPPGIYTCCERKICTFDGKLLGGGLLPYFLKALESSNPVIRAEARKAWEEFFGKPPSDKKEENEKMVANLETQFSGNEKALEVLHSFDSSMEKTLKAAREMERSVEDLHEKASAGKQSLQVFLSQLKNPQAQTIGKVDGSKNSAGVVTAHALDMGDKQHFHAPVYVFGNGGDPHQLVSQLSDLRLEPSTNLSAPKLSVPAMAFGKASWERYFGDIGVEPPLPPNIEEILSGPCPFWKGKTVRETHLLTLIPQTVNGKPFTLDALGELVKNPKEGWKTGYRNYWEKIQKELGSIAPTTSYWALMTRDVIPDSRKKKFEEQKNMASRYAPYAMPCLLEAATAVLMEHASTGTRLYGDNPWTFTRCQERVSSNPNWPLVVGGFSAGGLFVLLGHDVEAENGGVSALRKF